MSLERISYRNLPLAVRNRIEDVTGVVLSATSVGEGLNSAVAALLDTSRGHYFVKALPADHRWVWTQGREAEIAQDVRSVAASLCARVADHGWDVLVFEALEGHQADYGPESADLPHVVNLLTRIGELPCPATVLRQAEQRLQTYADASELYHFAGEALLHTDLNCTNVIVGEDRARIVDWGWATRGAPWLDAAYWVIWLIAAGHKAQSAERWAANVPAWHKAPASGLTAFAAANTRMWVEIGGGNPDDWTRRLIIAADTWHEFRTVLSDE